MMDRPSYQRWGSLTEQRPLRILSIDGGGVRGYSTLLLLQEVMHKLFVEMEGRAPEAWELPRPCDHFDLIAGSGTGGLIAILLGRLRIDIATALEFYAEISQYILQEDKTLGGIPYGKTLFKASKFEDAIKEVVGKYETDDINDRRKKINHSPSIHSSSSASLRQFRFSILSPSQSFIPLEENEWKLYSDAVQIGESALWYDDRPGRCKTFITAMYKGSSPNAPPAILRTYSSAAESCPVGQKCAIWEVARAACAMQPAFKAIQIGQNVFLDEGGGKLNPSLFALEEAIVNEWPGREVGVFISIGTGRLPSDSESLQRAAHKHPCTFRDAIMRKFAVAEETHRAKVEGCEQLHLDTLRVLKESGISEDTYFRLNVDEKVGCNFTSEWTRLADISNATRAYLAKGTVQQMHRSAARRLSGIWRMGTGVSKSVDRHPRFPVPGVYVGRNVKDVLESRHYVPRPIVPNLASEFGKLDPPYVLPQHSSDSPKTIDNAPAVGDLPSNHQPQPTPSSHDPVPALASGSSHVPMIITTTTPPPNPFTSHTITPIDTEINSSTTLSCRLPLTLPRISSLLPLCEQISARITNLTRDDLRNVVAERPLSLEIPSSASSTSGGSQGSPTASCNSSFTAVSVDMPKDINGVNVSATASPVTAGTCWNSRRGVEIPGMGVRTPQNWERERKGAGIGIVGVGVRGVGIVGVDGIDMKPHDDDSGSDVEELDGAEEEEIALHFKELCKLAGNAVQEARLVSQRGYKYT